jgi:hypothetical protein
MTTKIIATRPLELKADSKNALEERVAATRGRVCRQGGGRYRDKEHDYGNWPTRKTIMVEIDR